MSEYIQTVGIRLYFPILLFSVSLKHNHQHTMHKVEIHLICNERGELLNFMLTKANADDRNTDVFNRLSDNVFGKLFADKGYIS